MHLSAIRINLCGSPSFANGNAARGPNGTVPGRLRAFCSLTFDDTFVVRDVKLIEGHEGLFLAMPSRKLCDRCRRCSEKNHLRARFCNQCGSRLDETRHTITRNGAASRIKLHADVAHPINAAFRQSLEREVLAAYVQELERSRQPGYVPPDLDQDMSEEEHFEPMANGLHRLQPTSVAVQPA
jgi:stage V sporulation protein G